MKRPPDGRPPTAPQRWSSCWTWSSTAAGKDAPCCASACVETPARSRQHPIAAVSRGLGWGRSTPVFGKGLKGTPDIATSTLAGLRQHKAARRDDALNAGLWQRWRVVQLPRLERGTFGATIRRSNQLSYNHRFVGANIAFFRKITKLFHQNF